MDPLMIKMDLALRHAHGRRSESANATRCAKTLVDDRLLFAIACTGVVCMIITLQMGFRCRFAGRIRDGFGTGHHMRA